MPSRVDNSSNRQPAQCKVALIEHIRPEGPAQERPEQDRALGTAAGKLDAREAAREDVPVLDPGHDKAKAVKSMGNLVLAVAQRDDRARGRGDPLERRGKRAVNSREQAARDTGRRGHDHGIGLDHG